PRFVLGSNDRPGQLVIHSDLVQPGLGIHLARYQIDTTAAGLLLSQVHSSDLTTRLSLLDARGQLLVSSDGGSPGDRHNQIDQHLAPGTYFLLVESRAGAG